MIDSLTLHGADLMRALGETGFMVAVALVAAVLLGLPLGTLITLTRPGAILERRGVWIIADLYVTVVRSFPFLLFVVFLIPFTRLLIGTSFGTVAGTVPLCFVAVAIYARLTEQILLEVPPGITRAARAMGASTRQIVTRFLLVEARSGLVYALTSATITLISYSTILGVVGAGGLGDFAMRYGYQYYDWPLMYAAVALTVVCVFAVQLSGVWISRSLDHRQIRNP